MHSTKCKTCRCMEDLFSNHKNTLGSLHRVIEYLEKYGSSTIFRDVKRAVNFYRIEKSEEEVTSRWKDKYRRELKKVSFSCSGDGANNYKPTWTYFEMMGFLKDVMTPAVKSGNLSTCHQSDDKIDVEIEDDDTRDTDIEVPPSTSITSNVSEKQP
ncbi:unnamed protein product [Brassicogethes aeneus]|uniref:MADF domain-containing protein n=1 Tax=Brassicogethes aeneus TaxID=1431903 RepID=A0A9P0BES5_BRAAE|nr:unnamed protein product [Brassicogethes aeneus]